ncbi:HAD family hydrolase [Paenibacillus sp. HJGM_3]|uniref:HAD family hydrolase n=1 Tax=Paenibacillus sp. HJGM_3 TaxID=3379816 RepID=UPI00385D3450
MPSPFQSSSEVLWNQDCYLRQLAHDLPAKKLLSLDIFDTLLFRMVSDPAEVFEMVAEAAIRLGIWPGAITPADYRLMRIQAERSARDRQLRTAGHDEVTLELIYEELPARIGDRERLLQLELEAEREVLYLNPNVASLIRWCRARGIRVALLSDMYLSSYQLRGLLQGAGLEADHIDLLLVSSERYCGKASGGLFHCLLAEYPDLVPDAVIHIGDQWRSDVQGAAIAGIPALHYGVIPDTFERGYHWDRVRHGPVLPSLQSLCKLSESTIPPEVEGESERFFYQTGVRTLGPFLAAFCEWVLDVCVAEGREEVHPLMREGVLLMALLEQIARQRGLAIRVKPLYVSRQATYLATLERFGERELRGLLNTDCTVKELFRILDIEAMSEPFRDVLHLTVSECETRMDSAGGGLLEGLRRYLLRDDIRAQVEASIRRQRRLLADYLRQTCPDPRKLVTVDIGYHGSMQSRLEHVLAAEGVLGVGGARGAGDAGAAGGRGGAVQPIHLLAIGGDGLERLLNRGLDIRSHLDRSGENEELGRTIRRSPAFVEELMMGDFGTALGYTEEPGGRVVPVLAPLKQDRAELRAKLACHAGVLAFQEAYHALRLLKPGLAERVSDSREWYKPLHRAISMPTPTEARLLGGLYHQDHYLSEFIPICQPISDHWFSRGEAEFLRICNFGPSTLNMNWPQGTLTLRSPYYLYNHALKNYDSFGSESIWFGLIRQVEEQGMREITLLGSGRAADQLMKRAYLHRITVTVWITSVEQLSSMADKQLPPCLVIASLVEEDIEAWREAVAEAWQAREGLKSTVIFPVV